MVFGWLICFEVEEEVVYVEEKRGCGRLPECNPRSVHTARPVRLEWRQNVGGSGECNMHS
jgi:hypothetical protein